MTRNDESSALAAAQQALTVAYGIDGGDLSLVKYRENHVFRLRHDSGDFAVRLHRAGYNNLPAIRAELQLLRLLNQEGFKVPGVVPTTAGDLYTTASNAGVEQAVSLLTWVQDAFPLGDVETAFAGTSALTASTFRRVGELAGRLHNLLARHPTAVGNDRPHWDFDGIVGEEAVWGDPFRLSETEPSRHELRNAVAVLRDHLSAVGKTPENYSIIHADLTPENILVADDDYVVIDFDDFGSGWHAFDIATLLFWFQRHPRYQQFKEAATAGYANTRCRIEDDLLAAMMLGRGLTYLGWAADRRGDDTAEFIAENVVGLVVDNAREYLAVAPALQ